MAKGKRAKANKTKAGTNQPGKRVERTWICIKPPGIRDAFSDSDQHFSISEWPCPSQFTIFVIFDFCVVLLVCQGAFCSGQQLDSPFWGLTMIFEPPAVFDLWVGNSEPQKSITGSC